MTSSEIKSLQRINQKLALIRGSKSDRSQQKGLYLQQQRETLLIKHVLKAHPEIEMILNENRALLANKRTMFKVYTQGRTAFGTHATRLIGTIRSNGFLYLENSKNMFPIPYVSQHLFPKEFSGQLNWAGKIEMRMTGISFQFIGSQIPTKLEGSITESNRIAVVTTSSEFEWNGMELDTSKN